MGKSVSVVIVSYEVCDLLRDCLSTLKAQDPGLINETIVVDNASTDGSAEMLEREFPAATCIRNTENVGFARATNQGLHAASAEYLLLLNPDTRVQPGAIERLVAALGVGADVWVAGPRLVYPDGRYQSMSARRLPTAFNLLCLWFYVTRVLSEFGVYWPAALQPHAGDSDVEAISGACMLLRRSTYDRLGPLDEVLPMGAEDLEYCARVTGAGGRIVCVHDAVVIHVLGASMDQIAEESHFRAYTGPLFFLRVHRGRAYTNRLRWPFCLGMAFRAVVNAAATVVTGKRGLWRARAYLRLVHWGLTDYDLEPAAPPGARSA